MLIKHDKENCVAYYDKLEPWIKDNYYRASNGKCTVCNKEITIHQMEIHRVKRGNQGGYYTLCHLKNPKQNCKPVCKDCHKILHSGEFGHVNHSY